MILAGRQGQLEALLRSATLSPDVRSRISVEHAPDLVAMTDRPSHALRHKQQSSMACALRLVREGRADGCISAGNTGAYMALGRSIVRMYPGIERPAIIKRIPSLRGRCYVLDLGANVDSSAEHLFQFALMGSLMAEAIEGKPSPRIALLNVGEEDIKGNEQVRLASRMLAECASLNYIGYVEGGDLFSDVADVVVCDGFVGNIALKTGEGVANMLIQVIRQALSASWYGRFVAWLSRPLLSRLLHQMDPAVHNGASLLGLQGVVVKSHGNANERAFRAAIHQAVEEVRMQVPKRINQRLDDVLL